jgi:predicted secreted protein
MAEFVGRKCTITGTSLGLVGAATAKTFSVNNELVDVTSDDDSGFRKLITDAVGKRSLDISLEGIFKDGDILGILLGAETGMSDTFDILFPTIGTVSGDFMFASIELGAPTEEGATFSTSLQSTGAFTFVPVV